jgi:hypothetical protein
MNRASRLVLFALGAGVSGWLLERVITGEPRYSHAFGGAPVPFLPVYAAGGALVAVAAPELGSLGAPTRVLAYGAALSALELAACALDRQTGRPTWNYDGRGACIDLPHAIVWGLLGLVSEASARASGV